MALKTKKAFPQFPSTCGFVVKRLLNLKTCLKKGRGEFKKTEIVLIRVHCKCSKSLLSGRFGYPYWRLGDSFCIRETPRLSGRVGMYVQGSIIAQRFVSISNILIQNTVMFACQLLKICPGLHTNEIHAGMTQASLESSPPHNNVYVAGLIKCKLHKKRKKKGQTTTFHKIQLSKNCNKWK